MFIPYLNRASIRIAHWIESFLSIDRLVCVVFPFKYKLISNKKFAFLIIIALILFQLILNLFNLFFRIKDEIFLNPMLNQTQNNRVCTASKELSLARDILDELVRSVIPILLQVSSSVIIICRLSKRRNNVMRLEIKERDRRFAITIVLLNAFFFITETPVLMSTIYLLLTDTTQSSFITTREQAIGFAVYKGTVALAALNLILPFFINMASNRIYRKVFNDFLKRIMTKL